MVKVPLIPLKGAQVLSLVKELKIPWPGEKKKKGSWAPESLLGIELHTDLEYPFGSHKSRE